MLLLLVLSLYTWLGGPNITPSMFGGDGIATLFYYANWHLIFTHQSYFDQFLVPSPLRHTWSLAIEEQFYLVWPLLIVAAVAVAKARPGPRRGRHAGQRRIDRPAAFWCTVGLAIASATEMAVLYTSSHGGDLNRVYYGTDTRAFELLVGAALALLVAGRPDHSPRTRRILHGAAPAAAVALGVMWVTAGDDAGNPVSWMFQGGLVLASVLAVLIIAGVAQPDSGALGQVLSVPAPSVDRRHFLRDLPVALAGVRPHDRRDHRTGWMGTAGRPPGRHPGCRVGQLLPDRATNPSHPMERVGVPFGDGGGGGGDVSCGPAQCHH